MAEVSAVVKAIIVVAVIVIVVAVLWIFFRQVYPWLRGEQLTQEAERNATDNFDALIDNIKKCQSFASSDCICDGFVQFPAAFPPKSILKISHTAGKVNISLEYGKKVLKNVTLENIRLSAIYLNKKKVTFYNKKSIDFKDEPPFYIQEDIGGWHFDKIVISSYLYKQGNALYFIIGNARDWKKERYKEFEKTKKCA